MGMAWCLAQILGRILAHIQRDCEHRSFDSFRSIQQPTLGETCFELVPAGRPGVMRFLRSGRPGVLRRGHAHKRQTKEKLGMDAEHTVLSRRGEAVDARAPVRGQHGFRCDDLGPIMGVMFHFEVVGQFE
jgi:hypothetical protein